MFGYLVNDEYQTNANHIKAKKQHNSDMSKMTWTKKHNSDIITLAR